jgi:hypothetical protein
VPLCLADLFLLAVTQEPCTAVNLPPSFSLPLRFGVKKKQKKRHRGGRRLKHTEESRSRLKERQRQETTTVVALHNIQALPVSASGLFGSSKTAHRIALDQRINDRAFCIESAQEMQPLLYKYVHHPIISAHFPDT